MAQGYVLVLRPSKPGDQGSEKKYFAQSKSTGVVNMDYLSKLIAARSSLSSADVKAVIDNLNFFMDMELQQGRIVQLGEFGNFRITVGSEGVAKKSDFHVSMLRPPHLVFTPGKSLRHTKKMLEFTSLESKREKEMNPDLPDTPDDPQTPEHTEGTEIPGGV